MPETASLFLLGMFYGATICSVSCLPYLGPYLINTGSGFREGVWASSHFLSGKILTYMVFGAMGAWMGGMMADSYLPTLQKTTGGFIILLGLILPFISSSRCCGKGLKHGKKLSFFALGISTSLIPCPSVVAFTLLAARDGSVPLGACYGLVYGLGLAVSPLILLGGGISMISGKLKTEVGEFMPYLRYLSAILMVGMGVKIVGMGG